MSKIVIAGGTGSVGLALASHLAGRGHEIVILTRSLKSHLPYRQLTWDGISADQSWGQELAGAVLINLAGELVDRVPTEANIALLEKSRVQPTRALVEAARLFGAPAIWLQMSTLAIYGDAGDAVLDESAAVPEVSTVDQPNPRAPRQMVGVARAWEAAVAHVSTEHLAGRLVVMRAAVILESNTPALNRLVTITKRFLGGTVGNGKQFVSWIHIEDFLNAVDFILARNEATGVVHLTSPEPIRNRDMMAALRKQLHRPWSPATPSLAIKIGARLLFRTDPALALTGRRAVPKRLLELGFEFKHPQFEEAIADLLPVGVKDSVRS